MGLREGVSGWGGLCKMKRKVHISKTLFILTIVQSGPRETSGEIT